MQSHNSSCVFCRKFSSRKAGSLREREWFDFPIIENDYFVAIPELGQLVKGYLLVIPRKHLLSMSQLSVKKRKELIQFVHKVTDVIEPRYGRTIIFEHGACHELSSSGACISHAHWHIVPTNLDLLSSINYKYSEMELDEFIIMKRISKKPYLLLIDLNKKVYLFEAKNVPGQYFRRILAGLLGVPGEWDYTMFPFFENIQETITELRCDQ